MTESKKEHDFPPFVGTSGAPFRRWKENLLGHGAGKCDDKGYSVADHLLGIDQGGYAAGAPGGGGIADQTKTMKRRKEAWALIYKHVSDCDLLSILSQAPYYQDGAAAMQYLIEHYDTDIKRSDLDDLDVLWHETSILNDIGVNDP